jgi:hypothetical protein
MDFPMKSVSKSILLVAGGKISRRQGGQQAESSGRKAVRASGGHKEDIRNGESTGDDVWPGKHLLKMVI